MRAAVCREYGPPEVLRVEEIPDPVPGPGEIVIDVHAAALNFPDVLMVANRYQIPVPLPFVPGSEVAGVVSTVGEGTGGLAVGDRVFAATLVGGFAERIAVPARVATHVPDGVPTETAAAFGVVYATAYHALRTVASLAPGETLLVLGAAGGVGLATVDLGVRLGARVIAAASSAEKLAACTSLGANDGIDYRREDLKQRAKDLTGGRGVDVVVDPVGGPLAELAIRATGWRGRYVCVGFASGEIPRIPVNLLLLKGSELRAVNLGPLQANEPEGYARGQAELMEMFRRGELRPRVSRVHPLDELPRALRDLAERRVIGKRVVGPRL